MFRSSPIAFSTDLARRVHVCLRASGTASGTAFRLGVAGVLGLASALLAAVPPPAPPRAAVEAALAKSEPEGGSARPLRVVLLADRKDHGPEEHDYPLWQERWALLLGGRSASAATQLNLYGPAIRDAKMAEGATSVSVERAWKWPSAGQFADAHVIVAFCYLRWTEARKKQVAAYLGRGGGLVFVHPATWTKPAADPEVVALTGVGGFKHYRHGELRVELIAPDHPIGRGLPSILALNDEPYWPPTPPVDTNRTTVLAVSREKTPPADRQENPQPLFWTCDAGPGRVFGCVPGHYSWTFDDPWFRLWLLRGIAWAAGEPASRFDNLALRGARVAPVAGESQAEAAPATHDKGERYDP